MIFISLCTLGQNPIQPLHLFSIYLWLHEISSKISSFIKNFVKSHVAKNIYATYLRKKILPQRAQFCTAWRKVDLSMHALLSYITFATTLCKHARSISQSYTDLGNDFLASIRTIIPKYLDIHIHVFFGSIYVQDF